MTFFSKLLFLVLALAQFLVPRLPAFGIGQPIGDRAVAAGVPPELPVGGFFAIWGVIFTGLVLIAILNLRAPDYTSERISPPLTFAALGTLVWMLSAQGIGHPWLDLLLLFPIAFFTWEAAYRLDRGKSYDGTARALLYGVTVGLFAGWLSVAISISLPDVMRAALGRGASDAVWQSLWISILPAAGMAYVFATYVSRNGWYFIAVAWGLFGILVNNWARLGTHALAIATAFVALVVIYHRIRFGARGSYPAKP
ncbi:MAG: hypothetical protein AAGL90_00960 [Pseudomonadota bacterium]